MTLCVSLQCTRTDGQESPSTPCILFYSYHIFPVSLSCARSRPNAVLPSAGDYKSNHLNFPSFLLLLYQQRSMKLTTCISAILALASTAAAGVVTLDARDLPNEASCINYAKLSKIHKFSRGWSQACSNLSRDCSRQLKNTVYV